MKDLRIGFDAKRYFNNSTGLGVYARNLVQHLAHYFPNNSYYLYTPKKKLDITSPPKASVIQANGCPLFWRSIGINQHIKQVKLDIYHGLSNEIPLKRHPKTRYIVSIHDVIWLKMPETYNAIDRFIYTQKTALACKYSDKIIATSEQTANDIQTYFKVKENKIHVLYQTVEHHVSNQLAKPIDGHYFIYLSSFEKRKNHLLLLEAFAKIHTQTNRKLILAGREGNTLETCKKTIQMLGLSDKVMLKVGINETEKIQLLQHADAFVYASENEGFGIPLIETALHNTPLILNNIPVFKELAGENALYFNVHNTTELAHILLNFNKSNSVLKAQALKNKLTTDLHPKTLSEQLAKIYKELV